MLSLLISILILLSSTSEPTINGHNTHIVDVLNPTSLETIKNRYNAYDLIDGDLTSVLKFETDYNPYNCTVKTYQIKVEVTNSRGGKKELTDYILVRDFVKPTIEATVTEIFLDISEKPTLNSLTKYFILKDNLNDDLVLHCEDFLKIFDGPQDILLDFYTVDNSSNRSAIVTVLVKVIESCPKTIINLPLKLTKKMTSDEIIELFIQKQDLPKDYITAKLNTTFENALKAGIYPAEIHFFYADNSKHVYQFKIDYNPIIEEKTKLPYIAITIAASVLIGTIVTIFIIRKTKKRH